MCPPDWNGFRTVPHKDPETGLRTIWVGEGGPGESPVQQLDLCGKCSMKTEREIYIRLYGSPKFVISTKVCVLLNYFSNLLQ